MFFFIGGIQPRTTTLDESARICPSCGLAQARLKRVDHYLSLFFIPLFPVKRGEPLLICDRCGSVFTPDGSPEGPLERKSTPEVTGRICRQCGGVLESVFRYCPYCGAPTHR
ncbi:MAG: zinc ribbon domain-containing protein [Deltaproteobacteria bacterium]|nr:zinc ribbon domain-containing protein [Deltaproteobacteria bacterium]